MEIIIAPFKKSFYRKIFACFFPEKYLVWGVKTFVAMVFNIKLSEDKVVGTFVLESFIY